MIISQLLIGENLGTSARWTLVRIEEHRFIVSTSQHHFENPSKVYLVTVQIEFFPSQKLSDRSF